MPTPSANVLLEVAHHLRRPLKISIAKWADTYRMLSAEANPEPGPWSTDVTPYLREPMETVSQDGMEDVTFMGPAQVAKTEFELNVVGYFVHQEPCPILVVLPTAEMGEAWSRERLAPMFRDTPVLAGRLQEIRSRDANNKMQFKKFPGGYIAIVGANSPSALAMRPVRVVIFDEIAKYPQSAGAEGDPISLATKRTTRFANRKHVKVSSPKFQNEDIHREFLKSDQRRYWVPCPQCGEFQVLRFRLEKDDVGNILSGGLVWPPGKPEEAFYRCETGACEINEADKSEMLARGEWRADNPRARSAGFWLHGLCSPFVTWGQLASEFELAKDNQLELQAFINTRLGEPWKLGLADEHTLPRLRARCESYQLTEGDQPSDLYDVPAGVAVLTQACDVQDNRIEIMVAGWGPGEEFWPIAYEIIWGNPQQKETWDDVDAFLLREYRHRCGTMMRPAITLVDSGAQTDAVYDFVTARQFGARRVFAVKGVEFLSRPQLVTQGTTKRAHVRLFIGSTTVAKDKIFSCLAIPRPGPGYIHLPEWVTDEFLAQLVSEAKIPVKNKATHRTSTRWVPVHARNEVLDTLVYNLFGLFVLQTFIAPGRYRDLTALAATIQTGKDPEAAPPAERRVRRFEL